MSKVHYKGYSIHPTPLQIKESEEWTMGLVISRHAGSGVSERKYTAADKFKTKDEATQYCLDFGRKIIDGELPDYTVAGL